MRDIALAGGMGSGKSTIADYLAEAHDFKKVKISEPIYEIAEKLWGPEAAKDRAKLQDLGEKLREIDPHVWIDYYVRRVSDPYEALKFHDRVENVQRKPIVNDTLRFRNEFWALKRAGFVMVRVLANEATRVDRLQKIGRIQDLDRLHHISETDLIGAEAEAEGVHFDFEIWNDTDTAHMIDEVNAMVRHIEEEE